MEFEVERVGDVAIALPCIGELDASNVPEFKSGLVPVLESSANLVLDLSRLRFIDSSGLGSILSCLRQLSAQGGDLKLCRVSAPVRAVFNLVRLQKIVGIYDTREEAIGAFVQEAPVPEEEVNAPQSSPPVSTSWRSP